MANFFDQFDAPAAPELPAEPTTADVMARLEAPKANFFDQFDAPQAKGAKQFGIDWSKPIKDVRAEVAKLPEGDRTEALNQWAEDYVGRERAKLKTGDIPGTINPARLNDHIRNIARGTLLGSWADEANAATSAAAHALTGGAFGSPYDEAKAYQTALDRAIDKEMPVASVVEQVGGAFGSGAPVAKLVMGAGKTTLKTLPRKIVGGSTAGGTAGYIAGLGAGEGDIEERHRYATEGEGRFLEMSPTAAGFVLGGVLPPALGTVGFAANKLRDVASPALARVGASVGDLPKRFGILASADGAVPEGVGARAHAEQVIANQLARAGKSVDDVRNELGRVQEARRLDSNSYAPDAAAIVDLDPSLQRLAGSASRASPEAANTATTFIRGRQTGLTPSEGPEGLARAGIPTRPLMSQPVTGKEAERTLGTSFGTARDDLVATGQGERIIDALKRAALIKDTKLHGLERNAYRTEQAIIEAAQAEAKPAYAAVYGAGGNVNISPELSTAMQKWAPNGARMREEPEEIKRLMGQLVEMFAPRGAPVASIERFDRTKRLLDDKIENWLNATDSNRSRTMGRLATEFKNDLLSAVDSIPANNLGSQYSAARKMFSSRMEAKEALQAGRDAFKENSDIGIDAYRAVTGGNEANRKLFLQGFVSEAEKKAKTMKRGDDKTRIFDAPNIQELLSEILPRSKSASAEFANRPERFGQYLENEKRMIGTRDVVTGNSKTAERIKDDEAYNVMTKLGETVERFRNSSSMTMVGVRAVESMLNKLFGMRADTAASIARQLFTANPAERERVLQGVSARLGRNRAEQFSRLLDQYQRDAAAASGRLGASPEGRE